MFSALQIGLLCPLEMPCVGFLGLIIWLNRNSQIKDTAPIYVRPALRAFEHMTVLTLSFILIMALMLGFLPPALIISPYSQTLWMAALELPLLLLGFAGLAFFANGKPIFSNPRDIESESYWEALRRRGVVVYLLMAVLLGFLPSAIIFNPYDYMGWLTIPNVYLFDYIKLSANQTMGAWPPQTRNNTDLFLQMPQPTWPKVSGNDAVDTLLQPTRSAF